MGRLAWAFVGIVCGAAVAAMPAYVLYVDAGHVSWELTLVVFVVVALAVVTVADQKGWIAEADTVPPSLALAPELPEDPPGRSAAGDEGPLHPILKACDWSGKDLAAWQPFEGQDGAPFPLIAFGWDTGDHYRFITKADLKRRSLEAIEKEALANIERHAAEWVPVPALLGHAMTASGTDFAAEKILSRAFLVEAQELLAADSILVGVPRRTVIHADADAPASVLEQFYQVFHYTFLDDSYGNAPITNMLFRYRDGLLIGAEIVE